MSIKRKFVLNYDGFIYRQIWLASSTDQKWRWLPLAFLIIVKHMASLLFICFLSYMFLGLMPQLFSFFIGINSSIKINIENSLPLFFDFFLGFCVWVFLMIFDGHRLIFSASIFYSIAADIVRSEKKTLIFRLSYYLSGSIAVATALFVWFFRKESKRKFNSSELDVLGTILSKSSFWKYAREIYTEIENLYLYRFQKDKDEKSISLSYAFASKWMRHDPSVRSSRDLLLKAQIREVLEKYEKTLSSEILTRLYEGIDEYEKAKNERKKIAHKFS